MDDADLEFREFFVAQYGRLCWLGLLLTGDRAQAEDLAQEALLRTYWMWSRVRRYERPGDYARKVLVNRHRSLLRRALLEARHARRTRVEEGYLPDHGEDRMVLWAAMQRLPARQRAVLVLRYHEDLPEAEVARLLGLPLGTVKSLAHRGLARLRRELGSPAMERTRGTRR
jgi:RNA polymerase sigma-70 factor (sigma-E family)